MTNRDAESTTESRFRKGPGIATQTPSVQYQLTQDRLVRGVTAIRDERFLFRRADTSPAGRDTAGSTAHSGSHVSSARPLRCLRKGPIGSRDSVEPRCWDNRAFLGLGMQPALPFGIHVAGDSTSVPVFRRSCPPAIMAYACQDARASVHVSEESFV